MSYARFGWGGSDVYIFLDVGGYLTCCGCLMKSLGKGLGSTRCYSTEEMLIHLGAHRKQGHTVPQDCIDNLIKDKEENDNWIRNRSPSPPD